MRLRTLATVTAMVLALTACGGGEGEEAEPTAGATSTAPAVEPTESATPDEAEEPSGEFTTYVVKNGDTLSQIAERFKTTVKAIVRLNKLKDAHTIKVGQKLKIPAPS